MTHLCRRGTEKAWERRPFTVNSSKTTMPCFQLMSYARIPQGACFYMATVLEASLDHKRNLKLQAVASSSVLLPIKFSTSTARNGPSFCVASPNKVWLLKQWLCSTSLPKVGVRSHHKPQNPRNLVLALALIRYASF